jgi:hypothetical protein
MRRARVLGLVGVLATLPFSGCSLLNLDELGARVCQSDLDCAKAQERAGLDPTLCGHCVEGLCDFQHRSETCNAADDDCDGSIDEDVAGASRRFTRTTKALDALAFATASIGPALTYVVASRGLTRRGFVLTEDGSIEQPADLRYDSGLNNQRYPCPSVDPSGAADCNFEELAIAVDSEHLVYATINTFGCSAGQLRIGLADRDGKESPFTVWLGEANEAEARAKNDISVGVAVRADDPCTGASSADGEPPRGARSPAVASIDTVEGGEGALAVWLSASVEQARTASCSSSDRVPVQALGVYAAEGKANSLLATDRGTPHHIGDTTSLAPPAVLPLNSPQDAANYLVGFASEEQGQRGVRLVKVSDDARSLGSETVAFIPDVFADRVILTAAGVAQDERQIGIAWTTACDGLSSLRFSTVSLSRLERPSLPLTLEMGELKQPPQLLYRPDGFSTAAARGGWFVLWAERTDRHVDEVKLARLADNRSEPLNVVTLASGGFGYALLLPNGAASVSHVLIELDSDDREQPQSFVGWCDVRG